MPQFTLDYTDLLKAYPLSNQEILKLTDNIVHALGLGLYDEWRKHAMFGLRRSRNRYLAAIDTKKKFLEYRIFLKEGDFLPGWIENGVSSFDMKKGLLKGKNAKRTKKGVLYNTVPFQFALPGAIADSPVFNGGVLPREIANAVKKKPWKEKKSGTQQGPVTRRDIKSIARKLNASEESLKNYQGLIRQKDKKTGKSRAMTFRRVSENSKPSSWIHPGLRAKKFSEMAVRSFNPAPVATGVIDSFLAGK